MLIGMMMLPALAPASAQTRGQTAPPADLRCEFLRNPLGVDAAKPRLSWEIADSRRDARQSAYHILVASNEALLDKEIGDLWDSGKVASDETIGVEYAGRKLRSGGRCCWKVRV